MLNSQAIRLTHDPGSRLYLLESEKSLALLLVLMATAIHGCLVPGNPAFAQQLQHAKNESSVRFVPACGQPAGIQAIAVDASRQYVATLGASIQVWERTTGLPVRIFDPPENAVFSRNVEFGFTEDNGFLILRPRGQETAFIWELTSGQMSEVRHCNLVISDGIPIGDDETTVIWNVKQNAKYDVNLIPVYRNDSGSSDQQNLQVSRHFKDELVFEAAFVSAAKAYENGDIFYIGQYPIGSALGTENPGQNVLVRHNILDNTTTRYGRRRDGHAAAGVDESSLEPASRVLLEGAVQKNWSMQLLGTVADVTAVAERKLAAKIGELAESDNVGPRSDFFFVRSPSFHSPPFLLVGDIDIGETLFSWPDLQPQSLEANEVAVLGDSGLYSQNGRHLNMYSVGDGGTLNDIGSVHTITPLPHDSRELNVPSSPDGLWIASSEGLWAVGSNLSLIKKFAFSDIPSKVDSVRFSTDSKLFGVLFEDYSVEIRQIGDGFPVVGSMKLREYFPDIYNLNVWEISVAEWANGCQLATDHNGQISICTLRGTELVAGPVMADANLYNGSGMRFTPEGNQLIAVDETGAGYLLDAETGNTKATFTIEGFDSWIVSEPSGRFEVSDFNREGIGSFIVSDEPLRPLPPEIFMRTNYEPDLLGKLLRGEPLSEVPDLLSLNRVQPEVEILGVEPANDDGSSVTVTVRVAAAKRRIGAGKTARTDKTGGYDLRLFRDGQLVKQEPPEASDAALPILARTDAEREEWRTVTQVCEPDGVKTVKFEEIKLPRNRAGEAVEFSAYAFNRDRVKSETHRKKHVVPAGLNKVRPTTYLVSVGVDEYAGNAVADLNYAVADARLMLDALGESFSDQERYKISETILVSARDGVSGGTPRKHEELATKANVESALGSLASATPDDVVILFFSGHGYTDLSNGKFYIFPRDLGEDSQSGVEGRPSEEVLDRCISSDDLTLWLRKVDAGEITLIVDTCHAAAAVEGVGDFKPGPMGSRGLGQLAYDKGMRVLAASQAGDVAIESSNIKQGLLTYALIEDGLRKKRAAIDGQITLGKLLAYGERRVPSLFNEILAGTVRGTNGQPSKDAEPAISEAAKNAGEIRAGLTPVVQMPRLFQYSRDQDGPVLLTIRSAEPQTTTK